MTRRKGFLLWLFAPRKVAIALAISVVLDWMEWKLHHPSHMGWIVLIHFVFALAVVAMVILLWQRLRSA